VVKVSAIQLLITLKFTAQSFLFTKLYKISILLHRRMFAGSSISVSVETRSLFTI